MLLIQGEPELSSSANREELALPVLLPYGGSSAKREALDLWAELASGESSGEVPNRDMETVVAGDDGCDC